MATTTPNPSSTLSPTAVNLSHFGTRGLLPVMLLTLQGWRGRGREGGEGKESEGREREGRGVRGREGEGE